MFCSNYYFTVVIYLYALYESKYAIHINIFIILPQSSLFHFKFNLIFSIFCVTFTFSNPRTNTYITKLTTFM